MYNTIISACIAVNIILAAIIIFLVIKFVKIEKRYNSFISKLDKNGNIEEALKKYIKMVNNVNEENKIYQANYLNLERKLDTCIQNIGIVRYNAFDDVGSELSFAIAALDNNENGIIINSIYGNTTSNVYAKPIENGTSKYPLSEEEIKALNKAKDNKKL